MWSSTLTELLGIRLPIIQAPMAGVSSPAMAIEAGRAGALGSIAVGALDVSAARSLIEAMRAATSGPFNVNLFCHKPARRRPDVERAWIERLEPEFGALEAAPPERLSEIYRSFVVDAAMLAMLVDSRPPIVSFHFGLPADDAIRALQQAGIVLIATATNLAEARAIEAAGLDAVIAQGWEAGGHRGCFDPAAPDEALGTLALTRLLVQRTRIPVIAAGGIMDGAGIAAVLKLGAGAAQLGTAFVGCDESLADAAYKQTLAAAAATVMTRVISGRPARCLVNRFTLIGSGIPDAVVPDYPVAYDLGKVLNAAAKARGVHGFGAQWAGQGAPLARSLPVAALVESLVRELTEAWE
ncbi:NAD(P)H-dependent flavin oxidoreductase [Lysobacter soli]|jgi:nitronate monooxygenase|uniref:NAD(P)H-dependent flavin oxidoreductase n=1 Tax=Lysobacter soli TaxID=453783 RepID=UPI0012ED0CDB|nr:nitronate monooxygenase [Lysobacter soli]MDG2517845.1 nitronate monooxygenase [Lysobacter soli]QGW65086.1 nitronate monooxygenase [Lysobacter soli]